MLKINELKNLRNSQNRDKHDEEVNMGNMTNTSLSNFNNQNNFNNTNNKTNSRIEIDADGNEGLNDGNESEEINDTVNNIDKIKNKNKTNNKKIFMTEKEILKFDNKDLFTFHDLIVPGGKNARLCLVNEPYNKNLRITDIADNFKFYEPTPVIVLIGANTKRKGKLFAGLSRVALNTRAVIVDSGLQTGLEKFCIRKNLNLIGIAPENCIEYPKPNPDGFSTKMLTNGHSHFILFSNNEGKSNYTWGDEAKFKLSFAERVANGRKNFPYKTKVVGVILGNIPNCEVEICHFIDKNWPLILIEDSDVSQYIKSVRNGEEIDESIKEDHNKFILVEKIAKYSKVIEIDDDSEILASALHISLTVSF